MAPPHRSLPPLPRPLAMTTARLGTFDDLLAERDASPEVAAIARRLRELVYDVLPEATEVVRLGDGASSLGLGEKKMSEAAVYIAPLKDRVNFGFYRGAELEDPAGLLEGTGKKLRHVKVRSLAEAEDPALRLLVKRAVAERRAALGL